VLRGLLIAMAIALIVVGTVMRVRAARAVRRDAGR
jgi:hypothetical protein